MLEMLKESLGDYKGDWSERKGVLEFKSIIAQRKTFLSTKKLTYCAKIRIDDDAKLVRFSEILTDFGEGLSSNGGFGDEMSAGFGFKSESYNTVKIAREGTIEEQSNLLGKKFEYNFNYKEIRAKVEEAVKKTGYKFQYQILPVK